VSRHWRALCDALDLEQESETLEAEAQARDYGDALGTVRLERFRETLDDMAGDSWGTTVDYFDAVAAVWALRKIPVLTFQRNGYSQGDSVVGLLVATPAHAARCGFDLANPGHDIAESLEGDANLFGAWAFGDVYGFDIQDAQGESLDSCWGFYGSPWSSNPEKGNAWAVLDAARDALEALAPGQAQARAAQAQAARVAFLEGKAQARAAQAQGFEGSRLCAMVRAGLAAQAQEWRDATRDARAWAALVADLGGVSHGV